ncbi:MAG: hypothetical protein U0694_12830 [Anaerolineae bacterium]
MAPPAWQRSGGGRCRHHPNPTPSLAGDTVVWTITVTNPTGAAPADVSLTKTEPNNVTIISVNPTGGTAVVNGQTITFSISSAGPGETITIILETLINSNTPHV